MTTRKTAPMVFPVIAQNDLLEVPAGRADSPAKLKAAMTDLENLLYSGIPIPPPEAQSLPSPPERKPPPKPKKTGKEGEQPDPSSVAYSRDAFWRLTRDPKQAFKEFYLFCFNLMKKSESRVMEMELATVTWSVTLQPKYPIMERVLEFIAAHPSYKAVNKDLWAMTLEFCLAMQGRELKDWNDEESWPSLLDEFVAWEKERASGNQEDVPMATQEEKS
ncbi:hypothetical protein FRB99_006582 [Tulasnella sp. 403]|nr:hypothetical protein FRB99_006582 [Tulasnella sp. 403]